MAIRVLEFLGTQLHEIKWPLGVTSTPINQSVVPSLRYKLLKIMVRRVFAQG